MFALTHTARGGAKGSKRDDRRTSTINDRVEQLHLKSFDHPTSLLSTVETTTALPRRNLTNLPPSGPLKSTSNLLFIGPGPGTLKPGGVQTSTDTSIDYNIDGDLESCGNM